MSLAQPVTIINEIVDGFNLESSRDASIRKSNDFNYRKLLSDINKLKKVDAFSGWQLQAALQVFTGDIEEFRRCMDIARGLGDIYSKQSIGIYFPTLVQLGLSSECQAELKSKDWPRLGMVSQVGEAALMSGSLHLLLEMYAQADEIQLQYKPAIDVNILQKMVAVLQAGRLNDIDIGALLDLAFAQLKKKSLLSSDICFDFVEDDGDGNLVIHIGLAAGLESLLELQCDFALAVAMGRKNYPRVHVLFEFPGKIREMACQ
ncbi:hypothetical protein GCM10010096_25550 [Alcaligenes pakistanensis]|uniref:Uncharacterized protein n=1 Tax=Alcaligenes pakistanensis TaxID=1482717 RepID=A0A8H9IR77_9BURK|nr:hypothetical protein [Alcaligenes pakistanensis]GHC52358.1 hypothetical protein GCM10010096_25550 [Alcaligenes pakistanensis]